MLASSSFETFIALQTNAPLSFILPAERSQHTKRKKSAGGGNFTRNGKRLNTLFLQRATTTESISNKSIIQRASERERHEKCGCAEKWSRHAAFASHIKTRSENRLTGLRHKKEAGGVYLRKPFLGSH